MLNYKKSIIALFCLPISLYANEKIVQTLSDLGLTDIKVMDEKIAELPNFKMVTSAQGIFYINDKANLIIQGNVLAFENNQLVNLNNKALMKEINALEPEKIVYKAKDEKYVVNVFMDITCHYCHLMFSKLKEYNNLGITVKWLAFPRSGLDSSVAEQMETIWQSSDPKKELEEAENGNLPIKLTKPNKIVKHFNLARQFGVNGTPTMVTDDGKVIPGYLAPEKLLKILEENK